MFFLDFTAWSFAIAGLACAAGPVIIHLLNRRRYRVVQWAAMDFLREALQRNRKMLQIRDLVLLALRSLAILFLGAALARPFFTQGAAQMAAGQPLHAVLVVDNSLSMAYSGLDGSWLDKAKARAEQVIDKLPSGSKISLIPACGAAEGISVDPYDTPAGALEALGKVAVVDRPASLLRAVNEAKKACESAPELSKRIFFFTDQQDSNWRDLRDTAALRDLPEMQVVSVTPPNWTQEWDNIWVEEVKAPDGLADVETPTTILVTIRRHGGSAAIEAPVQLTLGQGESRKVLGEKTVRLEAGEDTKQAAFEYVFSDLSELPEPQKPLFLALRAAVDAPDPLAADNERFLTLPVVAGLPVVFIDQLGPEAEDPARNQLGETRHLRKLLAPKASRGPAPQQLIKVRYAALDELSQDLLQESRLTVIAGIKQLPDEAAAKMLREYVQQGGRLVIAAGAEFDAAAWSQTAWLDGAGVLPLPLERELIGALPEEAGDRLRPFQIGFDSLSGDDAFLLPEEGEEALRDLYSEAFFFQAVRLDASPDAQSAWREAAQTRLSEQFAALSAAEATITRLTPGREKGSLSSAEAQEIADAEAQVAELRPRWLAWAAATWPEKAALPADEAARLAAIAAELERERPRVLARFDDGKATPFLVHQRIGRGEILVCSTGLLSSWNTLPKTNTFFIFDRLLRGMVQATLPTRNFAPTGQLTMPLATSAPDLAATLLRPHRPGEEAVDIGFIGQDVRGITLTSLYDRGAYRLAAYHEPDLTAATATTAAKPVWDAPFAVNGSADESVLAPLGREKFAEIAAGAPVHWVDPGEEISLAGATIRGQSLWWWLSLLVLGIVLFEMALLAWFHQRQAAIS